VARRFSVSERGVADLFNNRHVLWLRDPGGMPRRWTGIVWRALSRNWGRDVMLYTGGVSFFALLAVFPALGILIGLYGMLSTPEMAAAQATAFANLMPEGAEALIRVELDRLASAPAAAISVQSLLAFVITGYAAHRGFKALLAGLNLIHEEGDPHGFVGFNLLAGFVAVAAFVLLIVSSTAFLTVRVIIQNSAFDLPWLLSEWLWASLGLTGGLTLLYRYGMSRAPTPWRPQPGRLLGLLHLRRVDRTPGRDLRLRWCGGRLPDLAVVECERRLLRWSAGDRDRTRCGGAGAALARRRGAAIRPKCERSSQTPGRPSTACCSTA
jgi:uncharacterized BrkB/YihY/UPF0761 family membrane protein